MIRLTENDAFYLYKSGFTQKEIDIIDKAISPNGAPQPPININDDFWQIGMAGRQRRLETVISTYARQGIQIDRTRYDSIVDRFVRGGKNDIWDWLEFEYHYHKPESRMNKYRLALAHHQQVMRELEANKARIDAFNRAHENRVREAANWYKRQTGQAN